MKDMAMALEEAAQFRIEEALGPHYRWGQETATNWHFMRAISYTPARLTRLSEQDMILLIEQDVERLLRTVVLPKHAENELRKEAILGTLVRLGQIYQLCRKRWKKAKARELFWGCVQRVCLEGKYVWEMLERGKQAEASRKARQAEQQAAREQALAQVWDYAI
jgi:hypothetical protein